MTRDDDAEFVARLVAGSAVAFEELVARYQEPIFHEALRMLGDADEADCVVQDTFLRAHGSVRTFRGDASLQTWLTRIAVNVCLDRLRRASRVRYFHQWPWRHETAEQWAARQPASDCSPEAAAASAEARRLLRRALDALSPQQRVAFTLRYFEDRTIESIADVMRLEIATVKTHLARAVQRIKQVCRDPGEGQRRR